MSIYHKVWLGQAIVVQTKNLTQLKKKQNIIILLI